MTATGAATLAILGAGHRGSDVYGRYCLEHPTEARVVAVADLDPDRRRRAARAHHVRPEWTFAGLEGLLAQPRLADALVVATPDRTHADAAVAGLARGYDVLLEKPIALSEAEIGRIERAAAASPGSVTVAHVLRYTPFFRRLKELLDDGAIGELVQIQHAENIGYWHFAHSYVRGNWRNTAAAGSMLLAKACHDLDILRWLVGSACVRVASSGGLRHFTAANAPAGAPDRCTDGCPVAARCPFFAPRFYVDRLAGTGAWPLAVIGADPSGARALPALESGPYGRCVYRCDNDVADHQAVLLTFANGVVASLTVTAFTADNTRTIKLMGTRGELRGRMDTGEIELRRFLPGAVERRGGPWNRDDVGRAALAGDEVLDLGVQAERETEAPPDGAYSATDGHAGGDDGLMRGFVTFVRDPAAGSVTSLGESIESHLMAFAAERSRQTGEVVRL